MAAGLIKKKEKIARTVVDLNCPICGNMKVNSLNMYLQHRAGDSFALAGSFSEVPHLLLHKYSMIRQATPEERGSQAAGRSGRGVARLADEAGAQFSWPGPFARCSQDACRRRGRRCRARDYLACASPTFAICCLAVLRIWELCCNVLYCILHAGLHVRVCSPYSILHM